MQNQNKYILFSEYLTLKNAYIILGNNYDKIKEENKNLKIFNIKKRLYNFRQ